jgi:hypothetical protein
MAMQWSLPPGERQGHKSAFLMTWGFVAAAVVPWLVGAIYLLSLVIGLVN